MQIIGIVCEYNPFHNGHLYHLKKIKELFPNSLIVLVLNGYFLERGEISLISKKDKTFLSLLYGVDLVLELPFVFGSQSADVFANKSITILEELNCDYVVFGSESNDLETLWQFVNYTINNSKEYNYNVKKYLKEGLNYPTALAKALNSNITIKANDLLAISYLKSIKLNNFKIKPLCIKRTNDYLDTSLDDYIVSASNIRERRKKKEDISKYLPKEVLKYLKDMDLELLFNILKYKIMTDKDLSIYLDVDEGIENRLKKVINECNDLDTLIMKMKTRRYTYNKIRRMLIHILIGLTKEDNKKIELEYIRVLGFNNKGVEYLNKIKKKKKELFKVNKKTLLYSYELKSAYLYDLITKDNNILFENNNKPIIKMSIFK